MEKDFNKTIVNEVDIIIQVIEIVDNKYFKLIWGNRFSETVFQENEKVTTQNIGSYRNIDINPVGGLPFDEVVLKLSGIEKNYSSIIKDSTNKWYYLNITPFKHDDKGKLTQVLCSFIDIIDRMVNPDRISDMRKEIAQLKNQLSLSHLTRAEKNILKLLVAGKSEKEISTIQSKSIHTIKTHLKNIHRKLNINKSTELVRFAINAGIA